MTGILFVPGCNGRDDTPSDSDYVMRVEQWRQRRLDRLKSPDGWLSLAGLYWLEPGTNTFGAAGTNDFVVKKGGIPGFIGTFLFQEGKVVFRTAPEIAVRNQGRVVNEIRMKDDSHGNPTVLRLKSLSWHIIKRGDKSGVRLKDSQHPRLKQLNKIDTFPIDKAWRIKAKLEKFHSPQKLEIPTVLGTIENQPCPGTLVFQISDKTFRLYPTGEGGELFLIFGDGTNSRETYGGGRFLEVEKPDPSGHTWLDFNLATNPPCVFSPHATCPLPPEKNQLPFRVTAGEKRVWGLVH